MSKKKEKGFFATFIVAVIFCVGCLLGYMLSEGSHECPDVDDYTYSRGYDGWRSARTDDANGFRVGSFEYNLYPPVDSVVITNRVKYRDFAPIIKRVSGDICDYFETTIEKKMIVGSIDTTYYENIEYGGYDVWYCDTSFHVNEINGVIGGIQDYDGFPSERLELAPLFPTADSTIRDCKVEIKMNIDTTWKEL